jgi:hypothetical protein
VLVELVGGVAGTAAVVSADFNGWGTNSDYRTWAATPLFYVGVVLIVTGAAGAIWLALPVRSAPRAALAIMILVGATVSVDGVMAYYKRARRRLPSSRSRKN